MSEPIFHLFERAPRAVAPYSHAVEADGFVFITGQIPEDPDDPTTPIPDDIEWQTRRTMENLKIVLTEMALGFEHVVSARVFITEFDRDYDKMNAIYRSYFADNRLPARTCIGVTGLAHHVLVEIDLIARRPGG